MHFLEKIKELEKSKLIPEDKKAIISATLHSFYDSYEEAIKANNGDIGTLMPLLNKLLDLIGDQIGNPFSFESYHERIVSPFDYYHYGLDFLRPVVQLDQSTIIGEERVEEIEEHLAKGENVILFSNHQTEPDPQAISLLLENAHSELAQQMIFVAGHRVTTDPLAVPFSKGRNLLCIYSKNYIEHPPEKKHEKVQHNQRTMKKMRDLLSKGGKCIYVAPSGGRDRRNKHGIIEVASFDPQSVEMFWFTANHSTQPTHFYPLALSTYDLLPPPNGVKVDLGEVRRTKSTPIHIAFGPEIMMEQFPGAEIEDKKKRRIHRADYIWGIVNDLYKRIS
jgi:glycerol-3-phosphate O-acyltransferase